MTKPVLVLAVATVSTALATPASAVLCMKKSGALFVREACKKKETTASGSILGTGPQGPQGDQGSQGVQGPQGPAGPGARWAAVAADGTIVAQSGGISLTAHPFPGEYTLEFGESMASKALFVTHAQHDNDFFGGVSAGPCGMGAFSYTNCSGQPDTRIHVVTLKRDGTATEDHGFYVMALP